MIKHIFKIIWNERRINAWIIGELILIFTILWFCCDYLSLVISRYMQPLGYDITNTYQVKIGEIPSAIIGEVSEDEKIKAFQGIVERLKSNPQIENVSLSNSALPYSGGMNFANYKVDSLVMSGMWNKRVSDSFFDVFKINLLQGRNFTTGELVNNDAFIIGNNQDNLLFGEANIMSIDSLYNEKNNTTYKVVGIADKTKRSEYESYTAIVYQPVSELNLVKEYSWGMEIAIRVKSEADGKDFRKKFIAEMRSQLGIKPFFLKDVKSISDQRKHYMKLTGVNNNIKTTVSTLLFLLANISLGIIGTFWLRIESRRSQIALQMAVGASRSKVKYTYVLEAVFLLLIASVIGLILAINIQATGILENFGLPMVLNNMKTSAYQLLINYLSSLSILMFIIVLSVWYPAHRASKISPALALKNE